MVLASALSIGLGLNSAIQAEQQEQGQKCYAANLITLREGLRVSVWPEPWFEDIQNQTYMFVPQGEI